MYREIQGSNEIISKKHNEMTRCLIVTARIEQCYVEVSHYSEVRLSAIPD